MSQGTTPQERERLQTIEELRQRVQHLHGLVERLAATKTESDPLTITIKRTLSQLRLQFTGLGFPTPAQAVGTMEVAARRGTSVHVKSRQLREGVAALRLSLDAESRSILAVAARRVSDQEVPEDGRAEES
jgi:hypothetical protein